MSPLRYGRRWGRFKMAGHFLHAAVDQVADGAWEEVGSLLRFMSECLIVRAGDRPQDDTIEYIAISPHFDEIEEGEEIPEYEIWFERERTCNACGGTEWGPPVAFAPSDTDEIVCRGCSGSVEHSRWVTTVKKVQRVRKHVLHLSGDVSDEDIAEFRRKWAEMVLERGLG